jgi:hypothetical protein
MRSWLLMAATIVALASACAIQAPLAPPIAPTSLPNPQPRLATNTCSFADVNLARITDLTYDPTTYNVPATTSVDPHSDEYLTLQDAFNRSGSTFKNLLCGLKGIFIIPSGSDYNKSWGFRDPRNPKDLTNRFVGISEDLWRTNSSGHLVPIDFITFEDTTTKELLRGVNSIASIGDANPKDGTETLLAVLAHEFGHVLWNDILVATPGSDPSFESFCSGIFPTYSWTSTIKQKLWRNFAEISDTANTAMDPNDPPVNGPDDPLPQEIKARTLDNLIYHGKLKKARKIIARLLNSSVRPWPSLFGSFSANEDFVETFRLYVLRNAELPLMSITMNVLNLPRGTVGIDIPATILSRSLLQAKLQCFDNYFLKNPPEYASLRGRPQ